MQIAKMTFLPGRAIQANTYIAIMINAFKEIQNHTVAGKFKGSEFEDFITLSRDHMQDKTELANLIADEISHDYQGHPGAYVREELKEIGAGVSFDWLACIHNQAIKTVKAFNMNEFSIVK